MKNEKKQVKILIPLIVLGSVLLFFPKSVFADGASLEISPSVLQIQAKPPADIWTPFTITNQGSQPVNLSIGYKIFDPQASQNGNVIFFKNGSLPTLVDKKIFDKVQIVDANNHSENTITIGPRQSTKLKIHIILPDGEPSSDYYFSLVFLEMPGITDQNSSNKNISGQTSTTTLQPGIALNVLLAVGDKEIPQGSIQVFSTNWFRESGPVIFSLNVFNNGLHFITPSGSIFIKNMFGQTVGKIIIPNNVILAGTGRNLIGDIPTSIASNTLGFTQNGNGKYIPSIVWPEDFLLGMYKATLSLSLSEDGPTYTRSIYFFSFPLEFLIGTALLAVGISLIYLRIKRKIL